MAQWRISPSPTITCLRILPTLLCSLSSSLMNWINSNSKMAFKIVTQIMDHFSPPTTRKRILNRGKNNLDSKAKTYLNKKSMPMRKKEKNVSKNHHSRIPNINNHHVRVILTKNKNKLKISQIRLIN